MLTRELDIRGKIPEVVCEWIDDFIEIHATWDDEDKEKKIRFSETFAVSIEDNPDTDPSLNISVTDLRGYPMGALVFALCPED